MREQPSVQARRRSVVARILSSYLVVLLLFALASGYCVVTFRDAVREATLLRQGYLPLALGLRDLVSNQDTWNSQLNHVTAARNPEDARVWFETALAVGRPKKIADVKKAVDTAFGRAGAFRGIVRREIDAEMSRAEHLMAPDAELIKRMFHALSRGEQERAQALRDELVTRGLRVQRQLTNLESGVTNQVDRLVITARGRETTALWVLSLLGGLTLLVGVLTALYAHRVLRPLSQVVRRAEAVAAGDLTHKPVIDSGDEIGELSATFEGMVQAIAQTRERLLATERLAAIGKMAAHVTHEVRNPLSSIALNLDLLEEELQSEAQESRALLRAIGQEVARLSALSDQYLSMAKQKAPELEESDLLVFLSETARFMRPELESHGVHLDLEVPEGLPWLLLDQGQMRQVFFNLVRNAREAMPEGGEIRIVVEPSAREVEVRVADSGPGVPEGEEEQLFDPFFTTKSHGTGLGLAVTAQIVTAHGGRLEYERRVPQGSLFKVILPRPQAPSLDEPASPESSSSSSSGEASSEPGEMSE